MSSRRKQLVRHGDVLLNRSLPRIKGTYAVLFWCEVGGAVKLGCAGMHTRPPGWHVYIGSAFGGGGVGARVSRHLRKDAKVKWQIDMMKPFLTPHEIWYTLDSKKRECIWAHAMLEMPRVSYLPRVGATDCDCRAHLFVFDEFPTLRTFRVILRRCCPSHDVVRSSRVAA
jgi:Uri superfamily endonuclease